MAILVENWFRVLLSKKFCLRSDEVDPFALIGWNFRLLFYFSISFFKTILTGVSWVSEHGKEISEWLYAHPPMNYSANGLLGQREYD